MTAGRRVRTPRMTLVAVIASAGIVACSAADSAHEATPAVRPGDSADVRVAASSDSAPADSARAAASAGEGADAAAGATPAWYDRSRTIDLTGDGTRDSVRLTARGTRADSMQIRVVFRVGGEEEHREEWGSSYELALLDSAVRHGPAAGALLRARLDSVLASVTVEPLEGRTPGVMAEDSAILKDFSPWPKERVIFSYGYESQPNLFWDAPRKRFVRLWSCC